MATTINRLNDLAARAIVRAGLHPDGAGLYLKVKPKKDGGFARSFAPNPRDGMTTRRPVKR